LSPLDGILVLDFSTLLPGPMASLMLAEAGAQVIKIERPGSGDEMRSYEPKVDADSVNFHVLNRGKRSISIDLKATDAVERLRPLIERADVVIEQFRPGVMDRLGLGAAAVHAINPRIIYCSITGWGQTGPKAQTAAHDLNYMAETGLLGLTGGRDSAPVLPPVLAADIAGGSMPAVINILLALRQRDQSGKGAVLDIAMGESLFCFAVLGHRQWVSLRPMAAARRRSGDRRFAALQHLSHGRLRPHRRSAARRQVLGAILRADRSSRIHAERFGGEIRSDRSCGKMSKCVPCCPLARRLCRRGCLLFGGHIARGGRDRSPFSGARHFRRQPACSSAADCGSISRARRPPYRARARRISPGLNRAQRRVKLLTA